MVLGDAEETITHVDLDPVTQQESVKVGPPAAAWSDARRWPSAAV